MLLEVKDLDIGCVRISMDPGHVSWGRGDSSNESGSEGGSVYKHTR